MFSCIQRRYEYSEGSLSNVEYQQSAETSSRQNQCRVYKTLLRSFFQSKLHGYWYLQRNHKLIKC